MNAITAIDAWNLPELQALCARLGVDTERPTTRLIIDFQAIDPEVPGDGGFVRVTHEFIGEECSQS